MTHLRNKTGGGFTVHGYPDRGDFLTKLGRVTICAVTCIILVGIVVCGMMCAPSPARAEGWTDEEIVSAIYMAEGGKKAVKPFGILSVPCEGYDACRRICLNTVRNNRKRFAKQTRYKDYLSFLASRYAPLNVANDPHGLNVNWLKNVLYFLNKEV